MIPSTTRQLTLALLGATITTMPGCGGGSGGGPAPLPADTVPDGPTVAGTSSSACEAPYYADKIGTYKGTFAWRKGIDADGTRIDPANSQPELGACEFDIRLVVRGTDDGFGLNCSLTAVADANATQLIVPDPADRTQFGHECLSTVTAMRLVDPFAGSAIADPPVEGEDYIGPLDWDYFGDPSVPNNGDIFGGAIVSGVRVSPFGTGIPLVRALGFVPGGIVPGNTDTGSDEVVEGQLNRVDDAGT